MYFKKYQHLFTKLIISFLYIRSSTPLPPKEFDRAISKPKIDYERKAREYLQAMLSKPRHHGYRPKKARRGDYPEMEFNDIEVPPTVSVIMARLKAERQIKQLYSHVFYGPISNEGKVRCN